MSPDSRLFDNEVSYKSALNKIENLRSSLTHNKSMISNSPSEVIRSISPEYNKTHLSTVSQLLINLKKENRTFELNCKTMKKKVKKREKLISELQSKCEQHELKNQRLEMQNHKLIKLDAKKGKFHCYF